MDNPLVYQQKIIMKLLSLFFGLIFCFLTACKQSPKLIVEEAFVQQLIKEKPSKQGAEVANLIRDELYFWESRLKDIPTSFTAAKNEASALVQDFHLNGKIEQLFKADSILRDLNQFQHEKDAGILKSLASIQITLHRFKEANDFVVKAKMVGTEKQSTNWLFFDTQFELGNYTLAKNALNKTASSNQYGYLFRMAKWKHWLGETDSAAYYFNQATKWAGNSLLLKQVAQANLADLYLHDNQLDKAYALYKQNLLANPLDHYSLQGMGRIALTHSTSVHLAKQLFTYQAKINELPDAIYNQIWFAETKQDSVLQKKYAQAFEKRATQPKFGGMYNKYLIELYTGILNKPSKALAIAEAEIKNRSTPQTYAWLVYTLQLNGNISAAKKLYAEKVSGKPLETLELYWMGKTMENQNKKNMAKKFYKAATENIFDLSPAKQRELE